MRIVGGTMTSNFRTMSNGHEVVERFQGSMFIQNHVQLKNHSGTLNNVGGTTNTIRIIYEPSTI